MLPAYPRHAGRRCEELQELEETMLMSAWHLELSEPCEKSRLIWPELAGQPTLTLSSGQLPKSPSRWTKGPRHTRRSPHNQPPEQRRKD